MKLLFPIRVRTEKGTLHSLTAETNLDFILRENNTLDEVVITEP
jgi:hypothetical protein